MIAHRLAALGVSLLLAGCATARGDAPRAADPLREVSVLLEVTGRDGRTYPATRYLNNDASRLCYTFTVPGRWHPGGESALLRSADGRAVVGVSVWSARELERFEGATLVETAATRTTEIYERIAGQALDVELAPFEASRPGAVRWVAAWDGVHEGRPVRNVARKVFVPIGLGWVAQVTAEGTADDDEVLRAVLTTLDTTSHPECYRPYMLRTFPGPRP